MNDPKYISQLLQLDKPTDEQYRNFAKHLPLAHSWYKHIPFLKGRTFVLFLNPDAGDPRMALSPRYLNLWKTPSDYTNQFGYLDYYWFSDENPGPLDPALRDRFSFTWYPWVWGHHWEIYYAAHHSDIDAMARYTPHPEGREVDELASEIRTLDRWQRAGRDNMPVDQFELLEKQVRAKFAALQDKEVPKLDSALKELQSWLESGCPGV